ncbi:PAS domain S-box protein [Ferviditalea candida]|uniref:histidine kinase n=1 Tax=Ferviditalea candida TaxID=3108399 RepID=A0ABU5ZHE0_9BACL|nr:PAS domain S-box protein [Paenibacillaceae bacterium T2]
MLNQHLNMINSHDGRLRSYQSAIENHPDGVLILDRDGRCRELNPAVSELTGYTLEEFCQKKLSFLILPQDLEKTRNHIQLALRGIPQRYDMTIIHKSGLPLHIQMTNVPIILNHEVAGVFCIGRDITARKQLEEQQRSVKQQLESFIENNVDPILMVREDGKVLRVNESFVNTFGWKANEFVGMNVFDLHLIPDEKKGEFEELAREMRAGNKIIGKETVRLRKDGGRMNVLLSSSPILDEKGEVTGWSVTLRDITEKKKSEELLLQEEKLLVAGQLAAGVAHEIRNPLTALKGFVQLMEKEKSYNEQYLGIMLEELKRIELITNELLMLSKPQQSQFVHKNLIGILQEVIALLGAQTIMNNIILLTDFETGSIQVHCDRNQLKQVFINFIKNAIEAMPGGGNLRIQVRKQGAYAVIRFIDEGCGIPQEQLAMLGQPFFTTKEKGTGLGLMVSRRIIENHHGTLNISSEIGVGTTMEIFFPVC